MGNHMLRDIMLDLIAFADKNNAYIIKANIDLNAMTIEATLAKLNGEIYTLHYSGNDWVEK